MSDYYDRSGNPISDTLSWAEKLEGERRVAEDTLEDGRWISTVWLGLDHSFGQGPPLIFETMVFRSASDLDDQYCERYSTEEQALAGHKRIVEALKAGRDPDEESA